jgi:phosphoribosylformylglycinamidine (FGAM) synthase-like enzyme
VIHKFSMRALGTVAPDIQHLRWTLGLPDLEAWRDYYIEFEKEQCDETLSALCSALAEPVGCVVELDRPLGPNTVMVAHRRGVVDNECESIITMCALLGISARAAKVAMSYSSSSSRLRGVIAGARYNSTIEELYDAEPDYHTLTPIGAYQPAEHCDLGKITDPELAAIGRARGRNLSLDQMRQISGIQRTLGLDSTSEVLIEALDARWSDHCAHTTWASLGDLLGRLAAASRDTNNPNIVSMFHDNAGVWAFYGGFALAVKAETHNGPSAISGYFGQLTKLGGVLRDIMGTGLAADPIGCFEYTATGLPEASPPVKGRPGARQLAHDTIRAIKEYGNTFGVPMMWSHMTFHRSYRAKPFALGGSVGILPMTAAERGRPEPGDLVMLIGGLTGNEGIHGASASSAGSTMDEASVQIGAPLEQVKFRAALIDLRDAGCLRALTDIGGAGLNSAVGEIGEACGVWINTALVPLKTSALPMWRILLSESQERMLLAVPPAQEPEARRILARHQVRATVIGRFTDTRRYCVFHQPDLSEQEVASLAPLAVPADRGELGFDVPYALLGWRVPQQEVGPPPPMGKDGRPWPVLEAGDLPKVLEQVIADAEVASQRYADAQYDSTVQGNTVYGPHYGRRTAVTSGYWAGAPVDGSPAAAVLSTAFNPWLFDVHPVRALRQMFCGLVAGQVLAGVALADICLCDNFYTPHLTEHWREWLVAMVDELAMLVRRFGTPIVSGKDSSAGSTHTDEGLVSVPPAVFLTALGKVPDHARLLGEDWQMPGNLLVRIGPGTPSIAGTVMARSLDIAGGTLDELPLDHMDGYLDALAAHRHLFRSGVRLGAGGLAAQLAVGALASGLGVDVDPSVGDPGAGLAESLFAEHRCGCLVEIGESDLGALPDELCPALVGRLTSSEGLRAGDVELLTPAVAERWSASFARRLM